MNAEKTVFAQILEHLPRYEFDKFVNSLNFNTSSIIFASLFT
jgi:hypothetical protein